MKIGIVGANGQVGTELCVLFENRNDTTPIPIVRNRLGTHFLKHQGLNCRITDITNDDDAADALSDLDVVVVAAFAWQYSQEGFAARGARKANEALVRNAVRYSPNGARVVYFSSQAAFGDRIGAPQYSDWSLYTREKRNAERTLKEHCEETNTPGYAFRLGFVHGVNQGRTRELIDGLAGPAHAHVAADPDKPSNVVHTITLADAIVRCGQGAVTSGVYSLVNEPQWTWREVCEYYSDPEVELHFSSPDTDESRLSELLRLGWNAIESRERTLRTLTVYVPDAINEYLFHQYLQQQRGGELGELRDRVTLERKAFEFDPVPGPFVDGLPKTRTRLPELEAISDAFELDAAQR